MSTDELMKMIGLLYTELFVARAKLLELRKQVEKKDED